MSHDRLALHGGVPVFPKGPPAWPRADENVREALLRLYDSGAWGKYHGRSCPQLAARLAQMHEGAHVHLCSSGTVAVELALRALPVSAGDEVILAGYDFAGNFRGIEAVGATPVLVDIDPHTWCLDASQLEAARSAKTRAVLVSHLHGGLADMQQIRAWADEQQIGIVEDACQSPGAFVQKRIAGTWGDVGVLSFGGSKLLTAGRGGALLTRDEPISQRIKIQAERGNDAYPLSELQAAVLLPQLDEFDARTARQRENVARLLGLLAESSALRPLINSRPDDRPVYYKAAWPYEGPARETVLAAVQAGGAAREAGFRGFFKRSSRRCRKAGDLRHAADACERTVVLHHPILLESPETISRIATALTKVLQAI